MSAAYLHDNKVALGNLRLVNRAFASIVCPTLFNVVPLWISLQSLQNIGNLSKHLQM